METSSDRDNCRSRYHDAMKISKALALCVLALAGCATSPAGLQGELYASAWNGQAVPVLKESIGEAAELLRRSSYTEITLAQAQRLVGRSEENAWLYQPPERLFVLRAVRDGPGGRYIADRRGSEVMLSFGELSEPSDTRAWPVVVKLGHL